MALRKGGPGRPRKYKDDAEKMRAYRKRLKRSVHFRSDSHLWETPQALFDELNAEFGFTVDVCALPDNAKCAVFYTPEQDGLAQAWPGVVWCNPPYGTEIRKWVRKAYEASQAGALVVCLLPSRTGSGWFQRYVLPLPRADVRYLDKRQHFSSKGPAPFDSAVAIFRPIPSTIDADQRLLDRLRWGKWSTAELQWLLSHLEDGTSPQVVEVIQEKLQDHS